MASALLAEAGACCPSPAFGQVIVLAYVAGGALVYLWLGSMLYRWVHDRVRGRETAANSNGSPTPVS